jgi:phage shock protein PspC (stress-responsive transcriptional regulator)
VSERHDTTSPVRHDQRRARRPEAKGLLVRPLEGRIAGGVSLGIAHFVTADVRVVRALWVASAVLSLGIAVIGYVLLWLLLPGEGRT